MDITKELTRLYGEDIIRRVNSTKDKAIESISTGSIALDRVLGVGGVPKSRITEIAGRYGSGKTTVCLHIAANAQKEGLKVAYIDAENKLDVVYAERVGINLEDLLLVQPEHGEQALEIADAIIQLGGIDVVIVDSVAALGSEKEREDGFSDNADVAKIPRVLNKFFRRNIFNIRNHGITFIFTNQLRDIIGSYFGGTTTTGGHGLKHYGSIFLRIARKSDIKNKSEVIGQTVRAVTKKNNVAPPFKECEFDIYYGTGIDTVADVFNVAVKDKIISRRGSYYVFNGDVIAQGKVNTVNELKENDSLYNSLLEELNGKSN